jgi:hypothetical protein
VWTDDVNHGTVARFHKGSPLLHVWSSVSLDNSGKLKTLADIYKLKIFTGLEGQGANLIDKHAY